jgi:hypothetical protein
MFGEYAMNTRSCPVPAVPRILGAAGAIPFALLAALAWFQGPHQALSQYALLVYGAVILSFVGALHWAFAMVAEGLTERARNRHYLWSVVPALLAWVALLLQPVAALLLLMAGFWSHYLLDRRMVARAALPDWYLPLRLGLTLTVSLALLFALAAALV